MGIGEKLTLALLALFVVLLILRLFAAPLRLTLKVACNTAVGFLTLACVNFASGLTGFSLGLNLMNALIIGILGLPGLIFLILLQWVFV